MTQTSVKNRFIALIWLCALSMAVLPAKSSADGDGKSPESAEAPSVADQLRGLEAMCSSNATAMAAHPPEESLYDRLGGREKIHEIVVEIVRRHNVNETIKHLLEGVNQKRLIANVTDFLVVGTGGEGEYHGLDMVEAHEHLKLTNAHFLAAGGDVMEAMKAKDCGEAEIQEVVCMFMSLRPDVVVDSDKVID